MQWRTRGTIGAKQQSCVKPRVNAHGTGPLVLHFNRRYKSRVFNDDAVFPVLFFGTCYYKLISRWRSVLSPQSFWNVGFSPFIWNHFTLRSMWLYASQQSLTDVHVESPGISGTVCPLLLYMIKSHLPPSTSPEASINCLSRLME